MSELLKNNKEYLDYLKVIDECDKFNERKYKIYCLINPFNAELFYIGCTIDRIKTRYLIHCNDHQTRAGKQEYVEEILRKGGTPRVNVLYSFEDKETARMVEKCLIYFLSNNLYKINLKNSKNTETFNYSYNKDR